MDQNLAHFHYPIKNTNKNLTRFSSKAKEKETAISVMFLLKIFICY